MDDGLIDTHSKLLKEEKRIKNELAQKAQMAEFDKIKGHVARLSKTDDGANFLIWLMRNCGYHNFVISADPNSGEINSLTTIHQAALQGLWLQVRRLIPRDTILSIEDPEVKQPKQ